MACSSNCPTQDHATYGECIRNKGIQIDRHALQHSLRAEKDKDKRLGEYETLRRQGYQPKSTTWKDVRETYDTGGRKPTEVTASG